MKTIPTYTVLILFFLTGHPGWAVERGVVMITAFPGGQTVVEGDDSLSGAQVSPASTFKVVLAWAGLAEEAIDLETRWEVRDKHVPGAPRAISLEDAMYHSSNDFFIKLARQLSRETVEKYMVQSGLFDDVLPDDWLGTDWWPVVKAGKLTVSPEKNHQWMCRVAQGREIEPKSLHQDLVKSMSWPSSDPAMRLHGKTGVYAGAVWFNGFGVDKAGSVKVVTVMLRGSLERRNEAIDEFYRQFDMSWDESMKARR